MTYEVKVVQNGGLMVELYRGESAGRALEIRALAWQTLIVAHSSREVDVQTWKDGKLDNVKRVIDGKVELVMQDGMVTQGFIERWAKEGK